MRSKPLRFGVIVTGRGEASALHELFNAAFAQLGLCVVEIVRRCEQIRPRKDPVSQPRVLHLTGSLKRLPTRDQELGLAALGYLREDPDNRYLLVIDDLEGVAPAPVFQRYRDALDGVLAKPGFANRASVHFLVNMLEAYFFANAQAVNEVAGKQILTNDHTGDVEHMPHPKSKLSGMWPEYRETDDGEAVTIRLHLAHILARLDQCCWLRATVAWCLNRLEADDAFYAPVEPSLFGLDNGCKANMIMTQTS